MHTILIQQNDTLALKSILRRVQEERQLFVTFNVMYEVDSSVSRDRCFIVVVLRFLRGWKGEIKEWEDRGEMKGSK